MTLSTPQRREDLNGRRAVSDSEARSSGERGRIDESFPLPSPARPPTVFPSINIPHNSASPHPNFSPRDLPVPQFIASPVVGMDLPSNTGIELQPSPLGVPPVNPNVIHRTVFPVGTQVEVPQPPYLGPAGAPQLHPEGYPLPQNIGPHTLTSSNHLIYPGASHPNISYYAAHRDPSVPGVPLFYPDLSSTANPTPYFYPPAPNQSVVFQTVPNAMGGGIDQHRPINRKSHVS